MPAAVRTSCPVSGLSPGLRLPSLSEAEHPQQSPMPVIGILCSSRAESYAPRLAAFMQGLKEAGFVEGQNFATEFRWANDQYDRLPDLAADLVRRRVTLIAAIGNNLPA